ncbi:MAG: glycosyltransferase family 4 protein [Actinomycetia bacterium]|nr:glycosyltransferase family 4 protein [Actinomycetota bacterium]MCG2817547.1 glycosyltransferase family 4 protein [Actinomycetes bacterium]
MKVSILTPNVSSNCLGRAYVLARILERQFEVEIVGPLMGRDVWPPMAGSFGDKLVAVDIGRPPALRKLDRVRRAISGDILYATKPFAASYGLGLIEHYLGRTPIVLDIDDWEFGAVQANMKRLSPLQKAHCVTSSVVRPHLVNSYWNVRAFERLSCMADAITVSNRFLAERFGGTIIYHARGMDDYRPAEYDGERLRKEYGYPVGVRVVMFLGTPHPHKGLEGLIHAVASIDSPDLFLSLVGIADDPYSKAILSMGRASLGERFKPFGMQPFSSVPAFLSMADVIAVPQCKCSAAVGQTPAKVFDAMAMARPIIATNVGDLEEILSGCGWVVPPDEPASMAAAIEESLQDETVSMNLGIAARNRFLRLYSLEAMEDRLTSLIESLA